MIDWTAGDWLFFIVAFPPSLVAFYRLGRKVQHMLWQWDVPYDIRVRQLRRKS